MKHRLVVPGLFLAALSVLQGETPFPVAIKDAHVVTVTGADLPKATVVLRNGLIEQVGANISVPADAWVIDGAELTVYPGFIDGLSTWGIPNAVPAAAAARTPAAPPVPAPTAYVLSAPPCGAKVSYGASDSSMKSSRVARIVSAPGVRSGRRPRAAPDRRRAAFQAISG